MKPHVFIAPFKSNFVGSFLPFFPLYFPLAPVSTLCMPNMVLDAGVTKTVRDDPASKGAHVEGRGQLLPRCKPGDYSKDLGHVCG